ncbi:MAG: hypothetical protein WC389_22650 [Lutibacter sp.]|jgi:hypothetical protein
MKNLLLKSVFGLVILMTVIVLQKNNSFARTKIKPLEDTVNVFMHRNDTVLFEIMQLPVGVGLITNADELGVEIYIDNDYDKTVQEFCKSKYIKLIPTNLCVEKIENTLYIIFTDAGNSDELLLTEIQKLKYENNIYKQFTDFLCVK